MSSNNAKLHPKKLLLSLGVMCSMLGVVSPYSVSSQTTPILILRVKDNKNTTFKLTWQRLAPNLPPDQKSKVFKAGEKFFVSYIERYEDQSFKDVASPYPDRQYLKDYWKVKFEKPLPYTLQGKAEDTWFVFKNDVEELQASVVNY